MSRQPYCLIYVGIKFSETGSESICSYFDLEKKLMALFDNEDYKSTGLLSISQNPEEEIDLQTIEQLDRKVGFGMIIKESRNYGHEEFDLTDLREKEGRLTQEIKDFFNKHDVHDSVKTYWLVDYV